MTRPQIVFCAHSPFFKTLMPLLNSTSVQCCISTNLFQLIVNDGNCFASRSFDLDVSTLHIIRTCELRNFLLIFVQLWQRKISTKQKENYHILCVIGLRKQSIKSISYRWGSFYRLSIRSGTYRLKSIFIDFFTNYREMTK